MKEAEKLDKLERQFYKETGLLSPYKDAPAAGGDNYEERKLAWDEWLALRPDKNSHKEQPMKTIEGFCREVEELHHNASGFFCPACGDVMDEEFTERDQFGNVFHVDCPKEPNANIDEPLPQNVLDMLKNSLALIRRLNEVIEARRINPWIKVYTPIGKPIDGSPLYKPDGARCIYCSNTTEQGHREDCGHKAEQYQQMFDSKRLVVEYWGKDSAELPEKRHCKPTPQAIGAAVDAESIMFVKPKILLDGVKSRIDGYTDDLYFKSSAGDFFRIVPSDLEVDDETP